MNYNVIFSLEMCRLNPDLSLLRGILEPLASLPEPGLCLVLVDGLCEAELHRADSGLSLASLLTRHLTSLPPWLRLVTTSRSNINLGDQVNIVRCKKAEL